MMSQEFTPFNPESTVLIRLRQKIDEYRQKASVMEEALEELEHVAMPPVQQVVVEVLRQAPDKRLMRRAIIAAVKARLPQVPHIAVVSTLHNKALFKVVDKDTYQLTQ